MGLAEFGALAAIATLAYMIASSIHRWYTSPPQGLNAVVHEDAIQIGRPRGFEVEFVPLGAAIWHSPRGSVEVNGIKREIRFSQRIVTAHDSPLVVDVSLTHAEQLAGATVEVVWEANSRRRPKSDRARVLLPTGKLEFWRDGRLLPWPRRGRWQSKPVETDKWHLSRVAPPE